MPGKGVGHQSSPPLGRIVEPWHQIRQGGFAPPGLSATIFPLGMVRLIFSTQAPEWYANDTLTNLDLALKPLQYNRIGRALDHRHRVDGRKNPIRGCCPFLQGGNAIGKGFGWLDDHGEYGQKP